MIQDSQTGTHLDADQLSMFVDGKANAHERDQMLAHLGQCAECRRVVFLMQCPAEPEASTSVAAKNWLWRRWMLPMGLAGAALACSLVLAVYLRSHRGAGEIAEQSARVQAPVAPGGETPAANNAGAPPESETQRSRLPKGTTASRSGRMEGIGDRKTTEKLQVAPEQTNNAVSANPVASSAEAGALLKGGKAADAASGAAMANQLVFAPHPEVAEVPAEGKNTKDLRGFAALKSLPSLRIEHDRGPEDGMSAVSGRVTDPTGAVVAGAEISLRDTAGKTRQTMSGENGTFSLAGVPPGHYELKVAARGFEVTQQTMDLKARDMAMLDSVLKVGSATETVAVQAQAQVLNTESASVATNQVVGELPSRLPAAATVRLGKRVLSLDGAGTLFVSRNGGKGWKKVKQQWTGKVARIESTNRGADEALSTRKKERAGAEILPERFELTTDGGVVWTSNDGTHWRAQ